MDKKIKIKIEKIHKKIIEFSDKIENSMGFNDKKRLYISPNISITSYIDPTLDQDYQIATIYIKNKCILSFNRIPCESKTQISIENCFKFSDEEIEKIIDIVSKQINICTIKYNKKLELDKTKMEQAQQKTRIKILEILNKN